MLFKQVLVYDQQTRAIISPLLSVAELRSLGVTLHVSIDSVRDAIPDVTAVYFVLPTPMNVRLLVEDAASGRYRDIALHFASPVPRPLLETMARGCVETGCVARIRRIVDQFLAFSALEHRLFSLNMPHSYASYAAPGLSDAAIESFCSGVASAVLCVFATLGVVPIIVASRGGPSEHVARSLDAGLREMLAVPGGGVFSGGGAIGGGLAPSAHDSLVLPNGRRPAPLGAGVGARPVLILADRDLDLATPLAHGSTYQGLVDDVVGPIALNRVTIGGTQAGEAGESASASSGSGGWLSALEWATGGVTGRGGGSAPGGAAGRTITLDAESDPFWRRHAGDQFPSAIEALERELAEVASREAEIRRSASGGGAVGAGETAAVALDALSADGGETGSSSAAGSSSELVAAIDSLPVLLKRKKMLETHSALLAAVMDRVTARMLPLLYEAEAAVWVGGGMDRRESLALIADPSKGSLTDRTRLAAMHVLTCPLGAGGGGGGAATPAQSIAEEVEACVAALRRSLEASAPSLPAGTSTAAGGSPQLSGAQQASLDRATAALAYVRQWRSTAALGTSAVSRGGGGSGGFGLGAFGGNLFSAIGQHLNKAAAQVNRLVQVRRGSQCFARTLAQLVILILIYFRATSECRLRGLCRRVQLYKRA